jgi:hypothetical protein
MFVDPDYANTSVVGNSEFHWESQKTTLKSCAYAHPLRIQLGIVTPGGFKREVVASSICTEAQTHEQKSILRRVPRASS